MTSETSHWLQPCLKYSWIAFRVQCADMTHSISETELFLVWLKQKLHSVLPKNLTTLVCKSITSGMGLDIFFIYKTLHIFTKVVITCIFIFPHFFTPVKEYVGNHMIVLWHITWSVRVQKTELNISTKNHSKHPWKTLQWLRDTHFSRRLL